MDGKTDWVEVTDDFTPKRGKYYLLWKRRIIITKEGTSTLRGEMTLGRCTNGRGFAELMFDTNGKKLDWSYLDKCYFTHVCEVSAPKFTIKREKKQ